MRINIDVLNAKSQLFETKRDLAVARHNVIICGLLLKQASGRPQARYLQAVSALLTHRTAHLSTL